MRSIKEPMVLAPPAGVRIRTRLRLSEADEVVVRAVGEQLGRLAGADLERGFTGHGPHLTRP